MNSIRYCPAFATLSSRGPGHRPFTAVTRVRIPLGSPLLLIGKIGQDSENYIIQAFTVLNATQSKNVLNAFPVLSPPSRITVEEYQAALEGLQGVDSLDREVRALSRVEQAYLRQLLFPEPTGRCAICGKELPTDLLVAGHIKKRSACSPEEKRDAKNIVMPVCRLGCDELFERGTFP